LCHDPVTRPISRIPCYLRLPSIDCLAPILRSRRNNRPARPSILRRPAGLPALISVVAS
jgi:hypothetical protein